MKSINKKILCFFCALAILTSCDKDFEKINTNPNAPEEVNASLFLPDILRDMFTFEANQSYNFGNIAVDLAVKQFADGPGRYDWSTNGVWGHTYDKVRNINAMIDAANKDEKHVYVGVAHTLRAYLFLQNTQLHGDIPYSEAGKGKSESILQPRYDLQENVFKGILNELEEANTILSNSSGSFTGDIVYNGDVQKWRKLANTLRLRVLLRLSNKWDIKTLVQDIVNNPNKYPVFESEADNFSLTFMSSSPNQYPIFNYRLGDILDQRLCKRLADTLLLYNDPRIAIYADPTPNSVLEGSPIYVGVPNGLYNQAINNYNGGEANQSHINGRYNEATATHQILTFSELQFTLSEWALKGWIAGDAEKYYKEGIKSAFKDLGLEVTNEYLENTHVKFSSDKDENFNKFMVQKWISSFYYGMEGYFEFLRTGIPAIIPGPDNVNDNKVPVRFKYPTEEQSLNKENYDEVIGRQGKDDINTKMWLLKF